MEEPDLSGVVPPEELEDRLRRALKWAGMKPGQMREYLGASESSMTGWLNGSKRPRTHFLKLWALRTGCDYQWLLTGNRPGDAPQAADTCRYLHLDLDAA